MDAFVESFHSPEGFRRWAVDELLRMLFLRLLLPAALLLDAVVLLLLVIGSPL